MRFINKLILLSGLTLLLGVLPVKQARAEEIQDWVIRDFNSEIIVNKDSSLDVVEKIKADCGDLQGKHGIFRVIPYVTYGKDKLRFKTPIKMVSITDENLKPIDYVESRNSRDHTLTWKIGNAATEVHGVNSYVIKYHVDNAIRQGDNRVDELYWNLNGNFWQIPIEKYKATIIFPGDAPLSSAETNLYSGEYGKAQKGLAKFQWDINILEVRSLKTLQPGEGMTVSVTTPKNFFTPYVPGFWDRYSFYFFIMIPLLVLCICIMLWKKYGRDPRINWSIAPEFGIPENLAPIEYGMALSDGTLKNHYLTAAIIGLATKQQLRITVKKEAGVLSQADYTLEKINNSTAKLSLSERMLLDKLFEGRQSVDISSLKNKFFQQIPDVEKAGMKILEQNNWIVSSSSKWMGAFLAVGLVSLFFSFMVFSWESTLAICLIASSIIILIFAPIMRRRTKEGAELLRRLKGFELYMRKAERYRQEWLEKQDIFEKFLPYAIIYGIAKEWVKKLKEIYGEEYFNTYRPLWYVGYAGHFDIGSFSDSIETMSHTMSSTLSSNPSSSGAAGGGFSGGGGGGGGGGGW